MNQNVHHLPRLGIAGAMRLFGLTARALRFYEERGLVQARRDRLNTRYYDAEARGRLEWIARLRKGDLPLREIQTVLDAERPEERARRAVDILRRRRDEVVAQLAAVEAALADLTAPDGAEGSSRASRPIAR